MSFPLDDLERLFETLVSRIEEFRERWPLIYRAAVWFSKPSSRDWLAKLMPAALARIPHRERLSNVFEWYSGSGSQVRQDALEYILNILQYATITIQQTIEKDFDQLIGNVGSTACARRHFERQLRNRFQTPYLYVQKVSKGSIRPRYTLPLLSFVTFGQTEADFVVKSLDFPPSIAAILNNPTPSEQDATLLRLAEYQRDGVSDFHLKQMRVIGWLEDIGISRDHAQKITDVSESVIDYDTVLDLVGDYLTNSSSDTPSIMEVCQPLLQDALGQFLSAFPDVIDAKTWLLEYVADCFWFAQAQIFPPITEIEPGKRFLTLERGDKPPLPAVLLPTAKAEELTNARNELHVIVLLEIGPIKPGMRRWYHGCSNNSAENILAEGISLSKCHSNRDFGRRSSFYLSESYEQAVNWAIKKWNHIGPAVVIFDVKEDSRLNLSPKLSCSQKISYVVRRTSDLY